MSDKKYFLSCDWGTTNFRLRLVDTSNNEVVSEITSQEGIARTFQAWKASDMPENERVRFFKNFLKQQITVLENQSQRNLVGLDIIISGMASSSIGLLELPYVTLPFDLNGNQAFIHKIEADEQFPYSIKLISGVRSDDDVMRGEETQLIGLMALLQLPVDNFIFILPGTHSKHLYTEGGRLVRFHTYMTGEMFNILSNHSILKDSIDSSAFQETSSNEWAAFEKGVLDTEGGLLNPLFKVRTNQLFEKYTKKENALYMSGLLIGSELQELKTQSKQLVLCSGNNLFEFYKLAIDALGLSECTHIVPSDVIEKAVVVGQALLVANDSSSSII